eukprot:611500-Alexandrium_andersonii.AAC.1
MMKAFDLWAASTFEQCAAGHPSTAWTSSAGQTHRLDYVLLPTEWQQWPARAYPEHELVPAIQKADRATAAVELAIPR